MDPSVTGLSVAIYRTTAKSWYDFATTGATPKQFTTSAPTTRLQPMAANAVEPRMFELDYATTGIAAFGTDANHIYLFYDQDGTLRDDVAAYIQAGTDDLAPAAAGTGASLAQIQGELDTRTLTAAELAAIRAAADALSAMVEDVGGERFRAFALTQAPAGGGGGGGDVSGFTDPAIAQLKAALLSLPIPARNNPTNQIL
jgi:hypothetical protein